MNIADLTLGTVIDLAITAHRHPDQLDQAVTDATPDATQIDRLRIAASARELALHKPVDAGRGLQVALWDSTPARTAS